MLSPGMVSIFFEIGSLMGLELTDHAKLTGQWPQGPFCLFLLSTGILSACHHVWHFYLGAESQTQVPVLGRQALS